MAIELDRMAMLCIRHGSMVMVNDVMMKDALSARNEDMGVQPDVGPVLAGQQLKRCYRAKYTL